MRVTCWSLEMARNQRRDSLLFFADTLLARFRVLFFLSHTFVAIKTTATMSNKNVQEQAAVQVKREKTIAKAVVISSTMSTTSSEESLTEKLIETLSNESFGFEVSEPEVQPKKTDETPEEEDYRRLFGRKMEQIANAWAPEIETRKQQPNHPLMVKRVLQPLWSSMPSEDDRKFHMNKDGRPKSA